MASTIVLNGESLSLEDLMEIAQGHAKVEISKEALERVQASRSVVDKIVAEGRVVYGVNTGFGKFAQVTIGADEVSALQFNLIRSHAAGVGECLRLNRIRGLLALRINVLCRGHSGVRIETLKTLVDMINANCLPHVPEQGTVGASGDLAPLAHVALGAIGEGRMWNPTSGQWEDSAAVLSAHDIRPVTLLAKEGLALINGTQLITSLGAEALHRAFRIARQADVVAALTVEALMGTFRAFDPRIHNARPHAGQGDVARRIRKLLLSGERAADSPPVEVLADGTPVVRSEISQSHEGCPKVQDQYSFRCIPQVHGVTLDTLRFVRGILETEINSATDNPMVFSSSGLPDGDGDLISGGNFHGEYPAKACDYLAIAVAELANISERRTNRMMNPAYSGLPAFLVREGGLNSGFMIPHCTAAALASENKTLCHPGASDTISTSAGQEDHVSMGGWAARKAIRVVENVEKVIAIELMCACQALDLQRPLHAAPALERVHELVRSVVAPYDQDRYVAPDIDAIWHLLLEDKVWLAAAPFLDE